jgi:SOS-response transcriptional repressor LexA
MDNMGQKLKRLRMERKMSQYDLSRVTGIEQATISRIERGAMTLLSPHASKLSGALGVPLVGLLGIPVNVVAAPVGTRQIPVLDYNHLGTNRTAALVEPQHGQPEMKQFVLADLSLSTTAFAMYIQGDSMEPAFTEGDLIVVDPEIQPKPGDCVVAFPHGKNVTFAQYRSMGPDENNREMFELVPLNPFYAPVRSDRQPITIHGVMVEHRKYRHK